MNEGETEMTEDRGFLDCTVKPPDLAVNDIYLELTILRREYNGGDLEWLQYKLAEAIYEIEVLRLKVETLETGERNENGNSKAKI